MPTEIKKVMEKKDSGVIEQVYPETHADAVIGLLELLQVNGEGSKTDSGGILIKDIPLADTSQAGLMPPDLVRKLDELNEDVSSFSVTVGTVETTDNQSETSVTNSGILPEVILDFVLPKGVPGEKGETALTISVGRVEAVDTVEESKVVNVGTEDALVLDFYLPKGPKGDAGDSAIPLASEEAAGLLSPEDKKILNELSNYKFVKVGKI